MDIQSGNKNDIGCLNGLKVLSLFNVILGHRLMQCAVFPKQNVVEYLNWTQTTMSNIHVWMCFCNVDNFLIIASLLLTLKILKSLDS